MNNVLALDLSYSNTGWAACSDGVIECGKQAFGLWWLKPAGKRIVCNAGTRFYWFERWLYEIIDTQNPSLIIVERAHLRGWEPTQCGVGLGTRVEQACATRGIVFESLHSGTLKKYATGNGNAKKPQMQAAAKARYNFYHPEEDEGGDIADALHLLAYAMEKNK